VAHDETDSRGKAEGDDSKRGPKYAPSTWSIERPYDFDDWMPSLPKFDDDRALDEPSTGSA
jgi:hypothetical protein